MRTPAEEARYQELRQELGFNIPEAPPVQETEGLLGFAGKTLANVLPGALEKIVQPAQSLLGMPMQSEIPNFFDVGPSDTMAKKGVGMVGELAEYLPALIGTEAAAIGGLTKLGLSAGAARIGGAGVGFGLPMVNHGAETAAVQGGVGALQTAAMDWGWRGKVAAGLLGGGAGLYEGMKGDEGSLQQGLIYGGLNLLGPTVIDPVVMKLTGYKPGAQGGGRPIAGQPATPPVAPLQTGAQGVMEGAYAAMNPAQRQAYHDALAGGAGEWQFTGPQQAPSGTFGPPQFPARSPREIELLLGRKEIGLPVEGTQGANVYGRGNEYDIFAGLQTGQRLHDPADYGFGPGGVMDAPAQPLYPRPQHPLDAPITRMQDQEILGGLFPIPHENRTGQLRPSALHELDQPIARLQDQEVLSNLFPIPHDYDPLRTQPVPNDLFPIPEPPRPSSLPFRSGVRQAEQISGLDIYGRQLGVHDVFQGTGKAINEPVLSPGEIAARREFETKRKPAPAAPEPVAPTPPARSKGKQAHEKIPSGLQKLLGKDVGWTPPGTPLREGFTKDAFELGKKLTTTKDVERVRKMAAAYEEASIKAMDEALTVDSLMQAQEFANRSQYFTEAAEYAEGMPDKLGIFRSHDPNYTPPLKPKVAIVQKSEAPPPKSQPEGPAPAPAGQSPTSTKAAAASPTQVRIRGRFGMETADVVSREGDTLTVQVRDPIFGDRTQQVLASDTLPVASVQKPAATGTVPFQDVQSLHLTGKEGVKGTLRSGEEGDMLGMAEGYNFDPEAVRRGSINDDGTFWQSGQRVWPTARNVAKATREAEKELEPSRARLAKAKAAQQANPQADIPEIRSHLFGDARETTWSEVINFWERKIKGTENYIDDLNAAHVRYKNRDEMLGSLMTGPGPKQQGLKGRDALSVAEGLKRLPPEAAAVIGEILHRVGAATGKDIDLSLNPKMPGAKAGAYEQSGRVAINLTWINNLVKNWDKLSEPLRARALMRVAAVFGHEISHVAHKFGDRSGLMIDGVPITEAVVARVQELSQGQRNYISEQIQAAKGESISGIATKYLAGDFDTIFKWYSQHRPGLTAEEAHKLAAGEVLAEVGSIELIKRTKVDGLPDSFRAAVDKFKEVLTRVIEWFKGNSNTGEIASLQSLQSIAAKMHDHFSAGSTEALAKAFPASSTWRLPPPANPFLSGQLPPTSPPSPPVVVNNGTLLKSEIARLGLRAGVGGVAGGLIGPQVGGNQIGTAEGVLLGSIAGVFGVTVAKKMLSGNFPQEIKTAFTASKGNPLKTMAAIMGFDKSLLDMGREARYGWQGEASTMSKWVRWVEQEFNLNLDPKMKALVEEGRGMGSMVLATVQDALDKVRWFTPNASVLDAVDLYFTGKLTKDQFLKLTEASPELSIYGQSMITAREGMTTLTNMFAAGMPKSKFRDHLIESSERYLGRFYSAYKEGKFNMQHFEAAKKDLVAKYGYRDDIADNILREHMREVQANRSLFGGRRGNSGQKIDNSLTYRRLATEEEIEAQKVVVAALEHDPFSEAYMAERAKLDHMESHKITDAWRDWLGEYKNPVERMIYTFQKVHPSSISAKIFDMLDNRVNSNGLKFAYTPSEISAQRTLLESELPKLTDPAEIARVQTQITELSGYGALPHGAAYGKLQGKWVDRFTRDEINTYATPWKWMEQPVLRTIANINSMVKISRTALNPLTVVRNYLQFPLMGLIAKVKPGDVGEAWNALKLKGEDYRTMLERHIIGADYVAAELSKGPGHLLSGHLDSDIAMKIGKVGLDKALKFYQQPDVLLRASTFVGSRRRFAQAALDEGKFATLQDALRDKSIIDRAQEFTNRYTMNYSAVPRIVKIGRQLPFVNLFISYTSEITRILKNLTEDVIRPGADSAGRMHAITVLGGMAAIPAMLTASFEGNLSETDKRDWDKLNALSPNYNRSRFRLPTYRDEQGRFHYFDITNLLPADNYSQMIKAFSHGDLEAAAAANPLISLQNTPLLNIAAEQIAGEDLRTGQKVQGFDRVREILKETLPPVLPPGYEGQRLIKAFSTNAEGGRGLTNLKTGVQTLPSDIIKNYLTGMRFGNVQLASVQKAAIGEAKQQIADQRRLMMDVTNTNVPQSEKERAQLIFNRSVEEIMMRLHSRMGQAL